MSTITTDLQLVSTNAAADATTGWTRINGGNTGNPGVDADVKVQGTNCIKNNNTTTSSYPTECGAALNAFTAINCTNKLIFSWRNQSFPSNLPAKGNFGGTTMWISGGATYTTTPYKVFDLDGSDTDLTGGWRSYAIDPARTSGKILGSLSVSSITSLGFTRNYLTTLTVALDYMDVTRYGTGIKLKNNSGITGQEGTFQELYDTDSLNANAYGVITNTGGIYYTQGKLYFGGNDATYPTAADNQTALTFFKDDSQTVVWNARPVTAGVYEIRCAANSTQHTVVQFGLYDYANSLSSGGITIKGAIDAGALASQTNTPGTLTAVILGSTTGTRTRIGQSFRNTEIGAKLKSAWFWAARLGTSTGTLTAKLYAHSGTYGTSSVGTGTALATSDGITASTVSTTQGWVKFTFSGANQYTLADNTDYVIAIEVTGHTPSDTNATNVYTNGSNSYPGNYSTYNGTTWTTVATTDVAFRLYTYNPAATWKLTATNTNSNNILKIYGSSLNNVFSANLNGNVRSFGVTNCTTTNTSTTVTTSGSFTTSFVVPGMSVSGTGIDTGTYVASIESATSLTLTKAATANGTVTLTFGDKTEIIDTVFNEIGTITPNGATITNCQFTNVVTTAPTSATYAMIINSSTEMSKVTKTKFINCNRAIRITAAGSYSFDGITFSGNVYDIENASTGEVIINVTGGGTASPTFINTGVGAVTTIPLTPRTISLTATDADGSPIQNARVLVKASGGTGTNALPNPSYNQSVTITGLSGGGTTATVTHTNAHNMITGDKILIKGASNYQCNGVFTITKTSATAYTVTIPGAAPNANPTGTIIANFVFLEGLTDVNGKPTPLSRSMLQDTPVNGWVRKSSEADIIKYKPGTVSGTVLSTGDTALSSTLILDQ